MVAKKYDQALWQVALSTSLSETFVLNSSYSAAADRIVFSYSATSFSHLLESRRSKPVRCARYATLGPCRCVSVSSRQHTGIIMNDECRCLSVRRRASSKDRECTRCIPVAARASGNVDPQPRHVENAYWSLCVSCSGVVL